MGTRRWPLVVVVVLVGASLAVVPVASPVGAAEAPSERLATPALERGNARFVDAALRDLLGRASAPVDHARWTERLDGGSLSRGEFARTVAGTREWARVVVADLYERILGRGTDAGGLEYWADRLAGGDRTAQLASLLYASAEFFSAAGGGTIPGYVDAVYENALERPPDPGGQAYWVDRLEDGAPRTGIARQFFLTVESNAKRVDSLYQKLLNRAPDSGGRVYWARRLVDEDDLVLAGLLTASVEYFSQAQRRFVSGKLTTRDGTVVATGGEVAALEVDPSTGAGTATITVAPPAVGQHIVASTGPRVADFAIGEVTELQGVPGGTRVVFVEAGFADAFQSGDLTSTVELPAPAEGSTGMGQGRDRDGRGGGCDTSVIETSLDVETDFDGHLRFGWWGYDTKAMLEMTPEASARLGAGPSSISCSRGLWSADWLLTIQVGPVPVPVTIGLDASAVAEANWPGTELSGSVALPCRVGFSASDEQGFTNESGCDAPQTSASFGPTDRGSASVTLPLTLDVLIGRPNAGVGLYGSFTPGLHALAEPGQDPWFWLDFRIDAEIGGKVDLGPIEPTKAFGLWELYTKRLLEAGPDNPPPPAPLPNGTTRVTSGNDTSRDPSVSSDGHYVAFSSSSTNLVPRDRNGASDIFLWDRKSDRLRRIAAGDAGSYSSTLSGDGRYVAFQSYATDLETEASYDGSGAGSRGDGCS